MAYFGSVFQRDLVHHRGEDRVADGQGTGMSRMAASHLDSGISANEKWSWL